MAGFNGSGTVSLDGQKVSFSVVRSARAKHVRLVIEREGAVRIVVPERAPLPDAGQLLRAHRQWILRQFVGLASWKASAPVHGAMLSYLGGSLRLSMEASESAGIRASGDELHVRGPVDDPVFIQTVLERWYRDRAREVLTDRVGLWKGRLDVEPARIAIRDGRTRWGSCSGLRNLNFSWRLVMAPMEVLEYVVIHELAHLREHNHSPAFWRIVEDHCPQYAEHKLWLRDNGPRLGLFLAGGGDNA